MKIRDGNNKDKLNYLRVQKEAFPQINRKRDSLFFDEKVRKKEIFILENKEYVGHICFSKYKLNPPFINSAFIEELAINLKFRGKGYGKLLIKKLIEYCKENNIVSIHLGTEDKENCKLIKFYEKLGFKKVGKLEDIDPNSEYDHGQVFYAMLVKN
jgi:ribosomal protein S18 acetylase RimI-like enzyme